MGNFLLLFALFGVIATFGPALYLEVTFRIDQQRGISYTVADVAKTAKSDSLSPLGLSAKSNQQVLVPVDTNFGIVIPKIGANSKVFANDCSPEASTEPGSPDFAPWQKAFRSQGRSF